MLILRYCFCEPKTNPSHTFPIIGSVVGATGNVAIAIGSQGGSTASGIEFSALRFILGVLILIPILPILAKLRWWEWLVAVLSSGSIIALFIAMTHAPAGLVAALSAIAPIMAAIGLRALNLIRLSKTAYFFIALTCMGALGLAWTPSWEIDAIGAFWSLAVVVLSSMGMILYGYFASRKDDPKPGAGPWGSTAAVNVIGMLIVVPMALLSGGGLSANLIDWGLAMVVVLIGGVVGMWFDLKSLHLFSSPVVMAFSPLAIVLTAVGATIFIRQPPPATAWIWFAVIAVGLFGIRNEKLS